MASHRFKFYRAGGLDQVVFRNGQDLVHLRELDQKLWVALACPTQGLDIEERTLHLLDTDKDGRLRPPELFAAIDWLTEVLKSPDDLLTSRSYVPLAALNEKTEAGRAMLATVKRVLSILGQPQASQIDVADLADRVKLVSDPTKNGDGVIPKEAASDPEVQKTIGDILATLGKSADLSNTDGVDQAHVDGFFADAEAYLAWLAKSEGSKDILPLGDATAAAAQAVRAVRAKVDDFFTRCHLAAFDPRMLAVLGGNDAEWAAVAAKDLAECPAELLKLPLAQVAADKPLPLCKNANPAWADKLRTLAQDAVGKLLSPEQTTLSETEWKLLVQKLSAYEAWQAEKPTTKVECLGADRLRWLVQSDHKANISAMIAEDLAVAPELAQFDDLEKLVRCQRDFLRLLQNFVSFAGFYGKNPATFVAGTLYLDGRACHLCLPVSDPGKHAALAGLSKVHLAYCDLSRPGGAKRSIVAAFTNGDVDNLMVGRNGVFYDRQGLDWDATITKLIDNPISLRQAFFAPYKNLIRLIEEQVAKRAAAAAAESQKQVETASVAASQADKTKIAEPTPVKKGIDIGTVAAVGVAVGGIATFATSLLAMFFGLGYYMPLGLLALMLSVSGPAVFVAWLKLRQRNIGPILDANGWALNGRVKITPAFAAALTDLPKLPKGAERALKDPFAEKRSLWPLWVFLLLLLGTALAWYAGRIDPLLPERAKSTKVFGPLAPSHKPPIDSLDKK